MQALEPRVMFDGAAVATATQAAEAAPKDSSAHSTPTTDSSDYGQAAAAAAPSQDTPGTRNVLFIDARVKDASGLVADLKPGTEVVYLRADQDGLAQMSAYLAEHAGAASVQILAHGYSGDLWLGSSYLSAENINSYSDNLARLGSNMAQGGDILIYACNTADGERGLAFVDALAISTGRDIAASSNRTGAGSDWVLEVTRGSIESTSVLSAQAERGYQYNLATITVTSNADTGAGTLRNQIAAATTGDTITFNSGMTVGLTSGQLVINKNLTIDGDLNNDGVADVTLDANYRSRVLQVQAGSNVMLDGLVITRGLVSGDGSDAGNGLAAANALGGGIWNAGTLTLLNTSITANAAAGGGGGGGNFAYDGGGGGGGGALGGGIGGRGGESGVSNNLGGSGSANQGGRGGADSAFPGMGGQGGTGVGGAGGSYLGYSTGGTGGTATNGSISIGGGGGGLGTDATGGRGGSAAGGLYNAVGGTINVIGNSIISNNLGAGGGGGGGGAGGSLGNQNGGEGGRGVGAVWNKGTFNITAANNAAMTNNGAGSGAGGQELGTGSPGASPAAVTGIYNDGGALNTSYVPNAPSVLGGLQGDSVTFTEGDSARLIDLGSNATVSDGDSADFNGGSVRVSITTNRVTTEDLLSIRNQGTGAGQIGVSGSTITYGGVAIGTFTGGSGSNDLVITFNSASATPAAVEALLHNLVYDNSNVDNPTASARTLSVTVYDGDSYTATTNTVTVTVVAVNDAPTLSPANSNTSYTEGGSAVVLSGSLTLADVDSTTFQGATVTVSDFRAGDVLSVGAPNGFTVSYDSGTGVLTLSGGGSLASLQAALRSITYSSTSDDPTAGGTDATRQINFTVTDSGGATSTAVTAQVALTGVNDAPTLSGGPYTWAGTSEDATSSAVTVATLLGSATHADPDGPASGIAITGSSGGGAWEYSTDGVTWTGVGAVSNSAALLLSSTTQLRFVPDGANGSAAGLTFRAWDQSAGTASSNGIRSTADTSTNGGSAAYSSGTAQASLTVSSVNDAPVLTPVGPTLTGLTDSDTNNPGVAVSSFLTGHVTDADTSAVQGIALTGLTSGTGTWQYSTNGGASWQNVGAVSDASALLLRSGDRVRFVPDGINGGNVSLTYHAWDQSGTTAGQQGTKVDASATGGANPFSAASDTATLTVTAIDDAPVVTASGGSAAFVEGNNVTSTPVVIDSSLTVSDSDSPQLSSATVAISGNFLGSQDVLAFTNNPATMGDIVASYDSGTGILTLSSAAGASAAQWQAALRSVTYSNSSDIPSSLDRTITFKVNDGNSDSSGANRTVTIAATNDAPTVSMPASLTAAEDTATAITGISFADADAGSASVTVTLSVGSGTLSATSGGGVTIGGTASALTLSGSIANINAFIAGGAVQFLGAANSTASVTLTAGIDDGGQSGGAAQTGSGTVTIAITPINDAPHVSAPPSIAVTEDVTTALSGISFSDVDAGSGTVSVQFSVAPGSGTLSATGASGVTVLGSGTGTLSLSGTLSDINAFVTGGAVSYTTAVNATGNVALDVTIDDGGNTGSGGSQTDHTTVTLTVTTVNDAPVNSVPGTQSVLQDGTLVFSTGNGNALSITDVDVGGGTIRVTLTASNGLLTLGSLSGLSFLVGNGTGDGTMVFEGNLSAINNALAGLSFAPTGGYYGPASVQITTNDLGQSGSGGGQTDTDTILINVAQPNPGIISVASSSANGSYKVGETVNITVTFDQAVNVSGGTPTLLLETGAIDRNAVYVGGSGSSTLTFAYVVQAGDHSADLDYIGTNALSLNGATIDSVSLGNPAFNTLPLSGAADSLGANAALVIDGVAPVVSSVSVPANGTYVAGQNLDFTVNFSENITVDTSGGTPRLAITLDTGGTVYASYLSGSGTSALVFRLTVASGQNDSNGISVGSTIQINGGTLKDGVGNDAVTTLNGVGTTSSVRIDAAPPTATISVADNVLAAGETTTVTITFNEAVTGLTTADFAVANGTLSGLSSSDGGITWTATLTPTANVNDVSNVITLNNAGLQDLAGNIGSGNTDSNNYAIDHLPPTASIVVSDTELTAGETSTVIITFNEAVTGLTAADFTVANGTLSNLSSNDGSITWTAAFTPTLNVENAANSITLNNAGVQDAAGNAGVGTTTSNSYAIDTLRPTASIVVSDTALIAGETSTVTITFSEVITGLTVADFTVANGTLSNLSSNDGGITWTAVLTPFTNINNTNNLITLNTDTVTDLAGNTGNQLISSNAYTVTTIAQGGDPEFMAYPPVTAQPTQAPPIQPLLPAASQAPTMSPLLPPPLFEAPTLGSGISTLGNIFITQGALAPSFLAQVFASNSSDIGGDGSGNGFLGFGGGDGGLFGSSSLSNIFGQDALQESEPLKVFDGKKWSSGFGGERGGSAVFGAPSLGQQLHDLHENEQAQLRTLVSAFSQIGNADAAS
ncbi:Ig-like domain-containing protein [Pseudomonas subflava]|uniref:Ig-like domain-containing protein n=1 Tax=Pseudomonas subflava TaxID=2952933 RepID=UPI003D9DF3D7